MCWLSFCTPHTFFRYSIVASFSHGFCSCVCVAELQAAMAEDKKWSSAAMAADDGKRSTKRLAAGEGGDEEEESKLFELSSKRCVNLVLLVASLYSLGLVQCHLVFGLVKALLVPQVKNDDDDANGELRPLDLELLLVLLRESGPRLRADDPTAIKDITAMVREAGAKSSEKDSRVRFLEAELERLNKQGKKTKHSSGSSKTSRTLLMDPDSIARMRKLIQRICKSKGPSSASSSSLPSSTSGGLHMSWDDLVNAETRGRWWRTGASWLQAGKDAGSTAGLPSQASDHVGRKAAARASLSAAASGEGADVAAAAARQRMNTDARRAAFGAIMGAESVDDALQKLADSNKSFRGTQVVAFLMAHSFEFTVYPLFSCQCW
jgi:nucleolar MIF4G domain-containing protein 1